MTVIQISKNWYFVKKQLARLLSAFLTFLLTFQVFAYGSQTKDATIALVRDAEIEALVADYAKPLLQSAGLHSNINVNLVNDQNFNAFIDGQRIFINIGTLLQAETPNEVIGVIAHETGHLASGHQYRLREQIKHAQTLSVIGMLVGLGAGIVGSSGSNSDVAAAGVGLAAASGEIALRTLMSYQRSEEVAADHLAITYLNKTGQSAKGMLKTFERFSNLLSLSSTRIDPYRISHPLPRERITALEKLAKESVYFNKKDSAELQLRHNMARAKIAGNMGNFTMMRRMFASNPQGLPARYGEAILALENATPQVALTKIRALVNEQPERPYFHELLGDAFIRTNNPSAAAEAYKKAVMLDPHKSSQIRFTYGRALLLTNNASDIRLAINEIKSSIKSDPTYTPAYSFLAIAYARQGKIGLANLATADMHYYNGNYPQARIFAARAQRKLQKSSAEWLRAQDILSITGSEAS
ncbi:MAG: peptidase [Candidatus Tokpelaia sp. JSC189]|nr:MAG: peptidase [Candidatus Tokpelaia sp. JSC189]